MLNAIESTARRTRIARFHSILYPEEAMGKEDKTPAVEPPFFHDLYLDQIVDAMTAGREEYNLKPFFYRPLTDTETIAFRHEVMHDLENRTLLGFIDTFADAMRTMRAHLRQAEKLYYPLQKQAWFLDAVEIYCRAVVDFADNLLTAEIKSRGLIAFAEYLRNYAESNRFTSLAGETKDLKDALSSIRYYVLIDGDAVTVRKAGPEPDYSADIQETFAKFRQGAVADYTVKFHDRPEMDHVEARILDLVARLYPDVFARLATFCERHRAYLDEKISAFDREIQFYIAYLVYARSFQRAGLHFCFPQVSAEHKDVYSEQGFDLALAQKLIEEKSVVVPNDFHLHGPERIFVVSGPNNGGKTTFARTFGQLHYLASIGLPVPGTKARLFLFDRLFTHFEREESVTTLRGKLEDDLVRIHSILDRATSASIIIMNEIFTSTTLQDARFLSQKVMEKLLKLDLLAVWVTFIDELASFSEATVSMVSIVDPENPALRTYKIVRSPANGLAYAMAIAEKYQLTYERIKKRVGR